MMQSFSSSLVDLGIPEWLRRASIYRTAVQSYPTSLEMARNSANSNAQSYLVQVHVSGYTIRVTAADHLRRISETDTRPPRPQQPSDQRPNHHGEYNLNPPTSDAQHDKLPL